MVSLILYASILKRFIGPEGKKPLRATCVFRELWVSLNIIMLSLRRAVVSPAEGFFHTQIMSDHHGLYYKG